jgi:hypothetical protein
VEDVHGVDDEGAVRGVLPDGVPELLDGLDGMELRVAFQLFMFAVVQSPYMRLMVIVPYLPASASILSMSDGWALSPSMSRAIVFSLGSVDCSAISDPFLSMGRFDSLLSRRRQPL